jgi:hypothetical protein
MHKPGKNILPRDNTLLMRMAGEPLEDICRDHLASSGTEGAALRSDLFLFKSINFVTY